MGLVAVVLVVIVTVVVVIAVAAQIPAQNRLIDVCDDPEPTRLRAKLDAGGDPNRTGWFGLTPLVAAVRGKSVGNVRLLIERGADVRGASGTTTPLHVAVEAGDVEIARLLLEAGADPNLTDRAGESALVGAAIAGAVDLVRLFLTHGARVDGEDAAGESVLAAVVERAANEKRPDLADRLLQVALALIDHGANVNGRSCNDVPIVALALPKMSVLRALVDRGAITDVEWSGQNLNEVIRLLLEPDQS